MIKISETEFGYVFQNEQITLTISKKTWEEARHSKPGEVFNDGIATVIFYKTIGSIRIQKTFKDKKIVMVVDDITWRYMWNWTLYPEKREELSKEYAKQMTPEEIKKRNVENFAKQFDSDEYKNMTENAYKKIEMVDNGTTGITDDTGIKNGEKTLTKEMVDTLTFFQLKEKIVKENYKAPNYAKNQQSIFSEDWRKNHWQLRDMGGKIGLFWDNISPYIYDYQIVWNIMMNIIFEEKNTNYTNKTYQNVKDQVKCWEEKAQKQNKPDQKTVIDVANDVGLPF